MSFMEALSLTMNVADESDTDSDESGNEYYPEDWREEETIEVTNEVVYQVPELQNLSQKTVVTDFGLAQYCTSCIPPKIHKMLFTAAAEQIPIYGDDLVPVISHLVSTWPQEVFYLKELIPQMRTNSIFNAPHEGYGPNTLIHGIISGLLNLTPQAKLKEADFSGYNIPGIFEIPLLYLPQEERLADKIMEHIQNNCRLKKSYGVDVEDGFENILSWKLNMLSVASNMTKKFQGNDKISITTETSLDLGDWMSIVDEVVGLTLQYLTPFRFRVKKVGIYNLEIKQCGVLRWLFSMLDLSVMDRLVLYGNRKAITPLMYHVHEEFKQLRNITKLDMGIAYPTLKAFHSGHGLKADDILLKEIDVLRRWDRITEIYLMGLNLGAKLEHWFGALLQPLQVVSLHACYLTTEDFEFLATSHHVKTLTELGLDKNSLIGTADSICDVLRNTERLNIFSAIDTELDADEKAKLVAASQGAKHLHTISMYEQENYLTSDEYTKIVELSCAVRPLRGLYMFPFNYKPFDKVSKPAVIERCQQILELNQRTDIELLF